MPGTLRFSLTTSLAPTTAPLPAPLLALMSVPSLCHSGTPAHMLSPSSISLSRFSLTPLPTRIHLSHSPLCFSLFSGLNWRSTSTYFMQEPGAVFFCSLVLTSSPAQSQYSAKAWLNQQLDIMFFSVWCSLNLNGSKCQRSVMIYKLVFSKKTIYRSIL